MDSIDSSTRSWYGRVLKFKYAFLVLETELGKVFSEDKIRVWFVKEENKNYSYPTMFFASCNVFLGFCLLVMHHYYIVF